MPRPVLRRRPSSCARPGRLAAALAALAAGVLLVIAAPALPAQTYDTTNRLAPIERSATAIGSGSNVGEEELRDFLAAPLPHSVVSFYEERVAMFEGLPERVRLEPDNQNDLAVAFIWSGRPDLGADILSRLVADAPRDARYRRNFAAALEKMGLHQRALEEARRANDLDPAGVTPYEQLRLLRLEYRVAATNAQWAGSNLHRPQFTTGFNTRGVPPQSFPNLRLAVPRDTLLRELMNTIRYQPDFADAFLCMGMLIEQRGLYPLAWEFYGRAVELGHARAVEIKSHRHAMGKMLPRGYTISSWGYLFLANAGIGVAAVALLTLLNFIVRRLTRGRSILALWRGWRARRRPWRPEDWASHHEDILYQRLQAALRDGEDPAAPTRPAPDAPAPRAGGAASSSPRREPPAAASGATRRAR